LCQEFKTEVDFGKGRATSKPAGVLWSIHNWQLQKSPDRTSDQISANSLDISKAFFGMVIWKFESSQVSQAVRPVDNGLAKVAEKLPMAGFRNSAGVLRTPNFRDHRAKWLKVSGHSLEYSRLPETATGDPVRSALRGRLAVEFAIFPHSHGRELATPRQQWRAVRRAVSIFLDLIR
jgi:hypothetical protein